jgi:hypothetical protein
MVNDREATEKRRCSITNRGKEPTCKRGGE